MNPGCGGEAGTLPPSPHAAVFMGPGFRRDDYLLTATTRPRDQIWIGLPVTAIAASLIASLWVGWAWQV
jgi:hypothetical protein